MYKTTQTIRGHVSSVKSPDISYISPNCTEATKEDGSPLNNKEQANALRNKTFASGQQYLMNAEVVDAEDSEDTNDVKGETVEVEDFDFENVLDEESDYAFVQDAVVCENENVVVLDLRGKDCIYNQEHQDGEDSTDILLDNQSTVHIVVNSKFLRNVQVSK